MLTSPAIEAKALGAMQAPLAQSLVCASAFTSTKVGAWLTPNRSKACGSISHSTCFCPISQLHVRGGLTNRGVLESAEDQNRLRARGLVDQEPQGLLGHAEGDENEKSGSVRDVALVLFEGLAIRFVRSCQSFDIDVPARHRDRIEVDRRLRCGSSIELASVGWRYFFFAASTSASVGWRYCCFAPSASRSAGSTILCHPIGTPARERKGR